ncbi:MAG: hypothetical protein ACFFD1_10730, partial [Candidatus Thorarchaeota archaeon]
MQKQIESEPHKIPSYTDLFPPKKMEVLHKKNSGKSLSNFKADVFFLLTYGIFFLVTVINYFDPSFSWIFGIIISCGVGLMYRLMVGPLYPSNITNQDNQVNPIQIKNYKTTNSLFDSEVQNQNEESTSKISSLKNNQIYSKSNELSSSIEPHYSACANCGKSTLHENDLIPVFCSYCGTSF